MNKLSNYITIINYFKYLILAVFFFYSIIIIWPQNNLKKEITFQIPSGSSLHKVSKILKKNRIIKNETFFILAVKLMGYEKKLQAGKFNIQKKTNNFQLIKKLVYGNESLISVTVLEGWSLTQISKEIENKIGIKHMDFLEVSRHPQLLKKLGIVATSIEGYLFPDTYFFSEGVSPESIIETMVFQFKKNFSTDFKNRMREIGFNEIEVITLASIIEGEAIFDIERSKVSSVYHNRLKKGMKLQADPTIQYIIEGPPRRLLNKDLKIESPYNTYLNYGLPPGPINNPGLQSIKAALFPKETNFYYFVAKGDGYHTFTQTEKEHRIAKKKFQEVRKKYNRQNKIQGEI